METNRINPPSPRLIGMYRFLIRLKKWDHFLSFNLLILINQCDYHFVIYDLWADIWAFSPSKASLTSTSEASKYDVAIWPYLTSWAINHKAQWKTQKLEIDIVNSQNVSGLKKLNLGNSVMRKWLTKWLCPLYKWKKISVLSAYFSKPILHWNWAGRFKYHEPHNTSNFFLTYKGVRAIL